MLKHRKKAYLALAFILNFMSKTRGRTSTLRDYCSSLKCCIIFCFLTLNPFYLGGCFDMLIEEHFALLYVPTFTFQYEGKIYFTQSFIPN